MFGGPHGYSRVMGKDTLKPKRVSETLSRFGTYFRSYWLLLILTVILLIGATWAQVTAPKLIGQAVDCFLTPAAVTAFGNHHWNLPPPLRDFPVIRPATRTSIHAVRAWSPEDRLG